MSLKPISSEFYGDNLRWFIGIVTNNQDPLKIGRVQVRIVGLHTDDTRDIPNRDLPWAQVLVPSTEGGISGIGRMSKILNGAQVFGFFFDGEISQIPFVLGSIHHLENDTTRDKKTNKNNSVLNVNYANQSGNGPSSVSGTYSNTSTASSLYPSSAIIPTNPSGSRDLLGASNAEKVFNFFLANGFTPEQAAAFVGNFAAESRVEPNTLNPNDKGKPAFGLAQWRASRYTALINFCATNGLDYKSLEGQLQFSLHELNTTEQSAKGAILAASNLEQAVRAVEKRYERPAPGTFQRRFTFARDALERFIA
jgi:hypothetical protein